MTVNLAYSTSEPNVGLDLNARRESLKCYMGDTGLLLSMAFGENALLAGDIHNRILGERLELNEGMLIENIVAQMIRAAGHELYFYSNSDRKNADERMEIDFLLDKPTLGRRHNISPIEVKSGTNYTFSSLKKFHAKFRPLLARSYLLHTKDRKIVDDVICLPLYMTPFLVRG